MTHGKQLKLLSVQIFKIILWNSVKYRCEIQKIEELKKQYSSNYHTLNFISKYDSSIIPNTLNVIKLKIFIIKLMFYYKK